MRLTRAPGIKFLDVRVPPTTVLGYLRRPGRNWMSLVWKFGGLRRKEVVTAVLEKNAGAGGAGLFSWLKKEAG